MDRVYDGHVEQQQLRDNVDKTAGQSLASEASGLRMNGGSLADRVSNCEAAGLSFSSITNRVESTGQGSIDLGAGLMMGMFDSTSKESTFGSLLNGSMLDSSGSKVTVDSMSGKLLTTDQDGKTIDYQSKGESERSSQRNASIIPALFLGSPLALFGMGAALTMTDHVQGQDQQRETNRLTEGLKGQQAGHERQMQPQNINTARGYISDITMLSMMMSQEKKISSSTQDIYSLSGLAPELFPNQRAVERNSRARENDKKAKKKVEMDKMAGVERKRQQMRVKLSVDRSSLTTKNLTKRKEQLENEIELAQGKASLAEVSRMHSELEVLDRALTRLSGLGL